MSDKCACPEAAQEQCWEWSDCRKAGHEEGCYVVQCRLCGYRSADCEEGIRQ